MTAKCSANTTCDSCLNVSTCKAFPSNLYTCVYLHVHCMCVCVHVCVCACVHVCRVLVCTCMCLYKCVHVCVCVLFVYVCARMYVTCAVCVCVWCVYNVCGHAFTHVQPHSTGLHKCVCSFKCAFGCMFVWRIDFCMCLN